MKIDNLLLNKFIFNNKEEMFNEGYSFKGKVLELVENLILIDVKGHGTIEAKLEANINLAVGEEVSFLVTSMDSKEIILKPLITPKLPDVKLSKETNENNPISNLLKSINIKETALSIKLVENLMRYNASITERNVTDGMRTLEKLFQLSNLKEEEKVVLLNQSITDKDSILDKIQILNKDFTTTKESKVSNHPSIIESTFKNTESPEKVDIKSLLVTNNDQYMDSKHITQLVKEFLGNEIDLDVEDEYIKIISFFLKNNIKPSLNNIKNLRELNEKPIEFANELKLIDNILNNTKFNDSNKKNFTPNEFLNVKSIISNKDDRYTELQSRIRNLRSGTDLKLTEDIKSLSNKIDFLREINKDLSFAFFPINHIEKDLDGILTLIKENKKSKNNNERTNIYINIETHNLGNIKISCQLISNSLSIKMNIRDEDLELFQSTEKLLIEKISLIGYSLNKIEFVIEHNIHIIDALVSNPNPTYILDLKV